MEDTLFPNDIILVNKLKYGPKLPRSPFDIPWVNIAFYLNDHAKKRINENWWEHKRLSGYSNIKNGDVLVFDYGNKTDFFVKRCMGIAADTLEIKKTEVIINGSILKQAKTVRKRYQFKVNNNKFFYKALDSLEINEYVQRDMDNPNYRTASLTIRDKDNIEQLTVVDSLQPVVKTYNTGEELFTRPPNTKWTGDNLGPFIIPKKGMNITLNDENYYIYVKAINTHEGAHLEKKESNYFIDGKPAKLYTFKQDYCFLMGDHRNGSYDGRILGFVPKEKIVGKVQCVLFSNYQDEFRWDRFFKLVK